MINVDYLWGAIWTLLSLFILRMCKEVFDDYIKNKIEQELTQKVTEIKK